MVPKPTYETRYVVWFVNLWFILLLFLFQDISKCVYMHPDFPPFYLNKRQQTIHARPVPGPLQLAIYPDNNFTVKLQLHLPHWANVP